METREVSFPLLREYYPLSTLLVPSGRQLRILTYENQSMMPECLQALRDGEVHTLSLAFAAKNGHLICLCLMNETTCLSIDRTIFSKTDYLRNMIEFKELFEGSCTLVGVDIW